MLPQTSFPEADCRPEGRTRHAFCRTISPPPFADRCDWPKSLWGRWHCPVTSRGNSHVEYICRQNGIVIVRDLGWPQAWYYYSHKCLPHRTLGIVHEGCKLKCGNVGFGGNIVVEQGHVCITFERLKYSFLVCLREQRLHWRRITIRTW